MRWRTVCGLMNGQQPMFRIRIGSADPAFYLNADPDPGSKPMRIQVDPDPGQTLPSRKVGFWHEKHSLRRYIQYTKVGRQSILNGWKSGLFVNFGSISLLKDTDPHSHHGSGSRRANSMQIRIRNTVSSNREFLIRDETFGSWLYSPPSSSESDMKVSCMDSGASTRYFSSVVMVVVVVTTCIKGWHSL